LDGAVSRKLDLSFDLPHELLSTWQQGDTEIDVSKPGNASTSNEQQGHREQEWPALCHA
jgi:hypothetical protein